MVLKIVGSSPAFAVFPKHIFIRRIQFIVARPARCVEGRGRGREQRGRGMLTLRGGGEGGGCDTTHSNRVTEHEMFRDLGAVLKHEMFIEI